MPVSWPGDGGIVVYFLTPFRPVSYTHLPADDTGEAPWVEDDKPQVIIVGFGRFGQVIGRLLMANKMRITVLDVYKRQ